MSTLFSVRVTALTRDSVKFAVRSVHPDSGRLTASATLALQLIFDPVARAAEFVKLTHLGDAPLSSEMDTRCYLSSDWLRRNARAFVARERLGRGSLEVWPTHPAWISHLRKSMAWRTSAYDCGPAAAAPPRSPRTSATHSTDPKKGFRLAKPKGPYGKSGKVLIPKLGASSYLADPVLTTAKAMKAAAPKLLGQPVLVVPKTGPAEVVALVELEPAGGLGYREAKGSWGGVRIAFADVKEFGRAWLKA